jgi:hypothetical protein
MDEPGDKFSIYIQVQDPTGEFACNKDDMTTVHHYIGKNTGTEFRYFIDNHQVFYPLFLILIFLPLSDFRTRWSGGEAIDPSYSTS